MTTDNAIAVLRRMQEPDPFEPQITQTAFDALEMAIDMIERYSTWSQTYSNMVDDAISRKAAVDVIHKYFAERIEQSPTHMTEDGEVYDLGICNPLLADNKALSQAIKELPSVQPEIIRCKDCKHYKTHIDCVGGEYNGCEAWTDNGNEIEVEPDGFCSYGERG